MLEYFQKLNSSFAEIETCQCRKYSFKSELRPPPWFYRVWSTVTTVPLYKTCKREEDKLRPLGVAPTMVRLLDKFAAVQNQQLLQDFGLLYLNSSLPPWFYRVWTVEHSHNCAPLQDQPEGGGQAAAGGSGAHHGAAPGQVCGCPEPTAAAGLLRTAAAGSQPCRGAPK